MHALEAIIITSSTILEPQKWYWISNLFSKSLSNRRFATQASLIFWVYQWPSLSQMMICRHLKIMSMEHYQAQSQNYFRNASPQLTSSLINLLSHLTINGITYSTSFKHLGNALILLSSGVANKFLPARIDYIAQILFDGDDEPDQMITLFAAHQYKAVDILNDPFLSHPLLQAQLWSLSLCKRAMALLTADSEEEEEDNMD